MSNIYKKGIVAVFVFLFACATVNPLKEMRFQPVSTMTYTIASWYKITAPGEPLKVYIEGDGYAFNNKGIPTSDPTPKSTFWREIAANDPSPNVVYLARPCQYMKSSTCSKQDWTSGRFSAPVIDAMDTAVLKLMKKAKSDQVILIGYSGGAQVSGLIAVRHPQIVQKWITVAGVVDYQRWAAWHDDKPLIHSVNLSEYLSDIKEINQIHYVGTKDTVVPVELTEKVIDDETLIVPVKGARHNKGYEKIVKQIYDER